MRRAPAIGSWLALAACSVGCASTAAAPAPAGLMVIISTNLEPTEFDSIQVEVDQQESAGSSQWHTWLNETRSVPSEVQLPTTVFVQAGASADQDALIEVTALLAGQAVVLREGQVQVPADRVAELRLVLAEDCKGQVRILGAEGEPVSTCPSGQSCQPDTGMCGDTVVPVAELPTYTPGDETKDAGLVAYAVGDGEGGNVDAGGSGADGGSSSGGGGGSSGAGLVDATTESGGGGGAVEGGPEDAGESVDDAGPLEAGECADCTASATQCASDASVVQTCVAEGGCPRWVTTTACGTNQTCAVSGGVASCGCKSSICTGSGTVCQDQQTLLTCQVDGDDCPFVASTMTCASPESCSGTAPAAACSLTCTSSCSSGQTTCESDGLATCTQGTNGCWAYGPAVACPGSNQSCTGVSGSAGCTCNANGACPTATSTCTGASTVANCAEDAYGCPYEMSTSTCSGTTPYCSGAGVCGACQENGAQCSGSTPQTCSGGQWVSQTACSGGTPFCNGAGVCGACQDGSNGCSGSTPQTCVDGQWSSGTACTTSVANATPSCSAGSCGFACDSSYTACSGACVAEATDPDNCDGCGNVCPYGLCQSSACAASFHGAGYPSAGSGAHVSIGASTLLGDQATSGVASHAVAIGVQTIEAGVSLVLGLYSDSAGKPGTLLAQTSPLTSVASGRTEGSISAVAVAAGTPYWVMIVTAASIHLASETPTVTWYYQTGVTYPSLPSMFSAATSLTTNFGDLYFVTAP